MAELDDERANESLALLVRLRRPDGRWKAGGFRWRPPGSATRAEAVDWGRRGPNEMIT